MSEQHDASGTSASATTALRSASSSPPVARGSKRCVSPVVEESSARAHGADASSSSGPCTKRARSHGVDPERRRGQRMMGVLTSTLTQFRRESETTRAASAASKRAAVEARLATKQHHTALAADRLSRLKDELWQARHLAERIVHTDVQRKTIRAIKRRQASFLFTPQPSNRSDRDRLAPHIPTSTPPDASSRYAERVAGYAVYYLPGKTLPEQEDALNAQEDEVDDRIDSYDDTCNDTHSRLVHQLDLLKTQLRSQP